MTAITNFDLTTKSLTGTGLFDELMEAVALRLQAELCKQRITGADYSKVYLSAMTAVLQQSTQFVLSKEEAGYKADLVKEQIAQVQQETSNAVLTGLQIQAQTSQIAQQTLLQGEQLKLVTAQVTNEGKRGLILDADLVALSDEHTKATQEIELLTAKVVTEGLQQTILTNQAAKLIQDISLSTQQELNLVAEQAGTAARTTQTAAETIRINADKLLIDKRVASITQDIAKSVAEVVTLTASKDKLVAETALTVQSKINAITQNTTLVRQQEKMAVEKALLEQKTVTEKAQTSTVESTNGILGAQKGLYVAQTAGFARDAEQKAAKLLIDTWSVRQSTDGADTLNTGLNDSDILAFVTKLKTGVGA